ncbi:glycoside hydrolase family 43 protein [Sphingosinicella sp. BN140058]|uniref:glycoside hydrolase family 43 protein n=1 Tax=Sphingosinicella sp. BN140058 TaxID=1892855 RepID=UPI0010116C66|nr:glycoside hydrolase family 43 protein [Sphingosinicella sp. BN140058]QAY75335.1 glycoside hydrolase [Sphingosinicella sp. BN140058]
MKRHFPLRLLGGAAAIGLCAASAPAAAREPLFAPVFARDFADPFVLVQPSRFIAYATNDGEAGINVQVALSTDLRTWALAPDPARPAKPRDAMPVLPGWAKEGATWAPEVLETNGAYVLYFTARHRKSGLQCVGAASAADPLGPFVSSAPDPLVCQFALGGTIDASPFRDADGSLILYFKNDGNNPAANKPAQIWGQHLSADGLHLEGEPVALLSNDAPWEGRVVEAPTMVRGPSGYTMLFSASDFGWHERQRLSSYAIGYATCEGALGPCSDAGDNPLLYSFNSREVGCLSGPGHQAVFEAAGRRFIAFHAWAATPGCRKLDDKRQIYVAPLGWSGAKPQIGASLKPVEPD